MMGRSSLKFVVYAPRYDESRGGAIVLHKLCHVLNMLGYEAYLWRFGKPRLVQSGWPRYLVDVMAHYGSRLYRKRFMVRNEYITPMAKASDIDSSVVVYPETVNGNPLHAKRYVRWFLHRPGFHTGMVGYVPGELYFTFQAAFDVILPEMVPGGQLRVYEYFNDIYKRENYSKRDKICCVVRKGRFRSDLPDLNELWIVDDFNHYELNRAFNECKICFFYDSHTMLSVYAALCGCIPVIVPLPGVSKEEWKPEEELRYGLAYGLDDIEYATSTRDMLLKRIGDIEINNTKSVANFVKVVDEYF